MKYESDPDRIYRQSFAAIRREADLGGFSGAARAVAERVVHACGMADVAAELEYSPRFAEVGTERLRAGAPILCDGAMTAAGVIEALVCSGNEILTAAARKIAPEDARRRRATRTALALEMLSDRFAGAVLVIGNAPTALFRLLELVDEGIGAPALVLAFPVGFVGARESKEELVRDPRGMEFLTLPGNRGGSAMAAAAVNALLSCACPAREAPRSGQERPVGQ